MPHSHITIPNLCTPILNNIDVFHDPWTNNIYATRLKTFNSKVHVSSLIYGHQIINLLSQNINLMIVYHFKDPLFYIHAKYYHTIINKNVGLYVGVKKVSKYLVFKLEILKLICFNTYRLFFRSLNHFCSLSPKSCVRTCCS